MKMVKSLILGSAAGLIAVSGAQAADLPVKAKAVEYVRICSLYGAGFYYIPGTDTCIKLGGYLRVETAFNASVYNGAYSGTLGAQNRLSNYYTARSRQDLTIDTRTATEYGVVRTFFDITFSWTTGSYTGNTTGNGGTFYSAAAQAGGNGGVGNPSDGGIAGGSVGVYHAFIQFAGFTMGKTISPFDAPWTNYPGNNFDGLVGGSGTVTAVNQLTYDAQFGNGVSGTLSLVDPTAYNQSNLFNASAGLIAGGSFGSGSWGANDFGGTRAPDIIGRIKIDQAWGLFQLSAVAHNNHAAYYGGTELTGHPDDKWGWAVQGALQIKNIPTGAGDTINLQAVYTDGATRYNLQSLVGQNFAMFGGSNVAYQSVGVAAAADGVFAAGTGIDTVQTWGMRGAFNHNWDPYWNSALYGAYAQVNYKAAGTALICNAIFGLGAATAGITSCNPDFNIAQLGFITRWTPVKNLTFSADVTWTHLDQKMAGIVAAGPFNAVAKPAATYELKDQDTVSLLLRAQRNF
ncbi:porin [Bradyrhizobium sp. 200]|uniref:porin n=1 Tax=Bradyrhizobium sp. 200 TaxID=2782665 RepID=UPI0020003089|nr:porin [Bradyrhizobium sp. 200]UPJ46300.1 porin [Bradyrhizobium sp. 200]